MPISFSSTTLALPLYIVAPWRESCSLLRGCIFIFSAHAQSAASISLETLILCRKGDWILAPYIRSRTKPIKSMVKSTLYPHCTTPFTSASETVKRERGCFWLSCLHSVATALVYEARLTRDWRNFGGLAVSANVIAKSLEHLPCNLDSVLKCYFRTDNAVETPWNFSQGDGKSSRSGNCAPTFTWVTVSNVDSEGSFRKKRTFQVPSFYKWVTGVCIT